MTKEHQASRTIVKSPPELWAECSAAGSLARHIGEFGEIRITRLEPETTVAWEGEHASGTVEIEPSGWGTKVTLTAWAKAEEVAEEPVAGVERAVAAVEEPVGVVERAIAGAEEPVAVVERTFPAVERTAPAVEEPISAAEEPFPAVETAPAVEEPISAAEEPISAIDRERVVRSETESIEEAADAEVEETSTEPDPAVAADPVRGRRWSRVIARTRALFKPRTVSETATVVPPGEEVSEQTVSREYGLPVVEDDAPSEPPPVQPSDDVGTQPPDEANAEPPEDEETKPSIDPKAVLTAALDSLGQAHHRPFSRA